MHDLSTTLVAVASAPGRGGVACIRISGPDAYAVGSGLFRAKRALVLPGDGRPVFGSLVDEAGAAVDHGYLVAFSAGCAFTREPTVELWPHGSPPVLDALLRAAVARGAVLAGPGEFTYRALRHGRLDLPRAEAIRDLVAARTVHQARVALAQAEGALSRRLAPLRDGLIELAARGEAAVEFADEAEAHLADGAFLERIDEARARVRALVDEGSRGRIVREGARVVLLGLTNVGKSSIFNRLTGRDRAIVSEIPGTTRDTIEETIDLGGLAVTLVDTAGLRAPGDAVESEGMRRARVAAGGADALLRVLDASRPLRAEEREDLERDRASPVPVIVVTNKIDAIPHGGSRAHPPGAIPVSAAAGRGFGPLERALYAALAGTPAGEDPVVSNVRHLAALESIAVALDAARVAAEGLGLEIALEDVRTAVASLDDLTGRVDVDDLYDRIFSTFCIGK